MSYVVFKTDTLLDIRAITMFGLSAKPNSKSPIGYFGTGLKMAIATLVRNGIPVNIHIGKKSYAFRVDSDEFRGHEYQQIMMYRREGIAQIWDKTTLPFTTQLARNWELWMAFRELHANTLDEGGQTSTQYQDFDKIDNTGKTLIVVGPSTAFEEVYAQRDTIFLPKGKRVPDGFMHYEGIEVFHEPSEYLYYRGMRVQKLEKPSIMTYNVLATQDLTEDRTLKDPWWVQHQLTTFLGHSKDRTLINHFLNATDQHWESTWNFDIQAPGATFIECLQAKQSLPEKPHRFVQRGQVRTEYIPIYRSPRMETVVKKAVQPPHEKLMSTMFRGFIDKHKANFDEDLDFLEAVHKQLLTHDIAYDPNMAYENPF